MSRTMRRALVWLAAGLLWLTAGGWNGAGPAVRAEDNTEPVRALQSRLADAGCYHGPLDGRPSRALKTAVGACPDQSLSLVIETGSHTAQITAVATDASCSIFATGSYDKTLRLWSRDGKAQRVLRLPGETGSYGAIFTVAMSPDGRMVAGGGLDARSRRTGKNAILVFDVASGAVIARLEDTDKSIDRLAFSADGRFLAAGLGGTQGGIQVYETASWRLVLSDMKIDGETYGLDFSPDGRLFAVSDDGFLRRYDLAARTDSRIKVRSNDRPFALAIRPDGKTLALSYDQLPIVEFYDSESLAFLSAPDIGSGLSGALSLLGWSKDGRSFVGTGQRTDHHKIFMRLWSNGGNGEGRDIAASDSTITAMTPCGNDFLFASGDTSFGRLDADGTVRTLQPRAIADMRDKWYEGLMLSADGRRVRFGLDDADTRSVLFDLDAEVLSDSAARPTDLSPRLEAGIPVTLDGHTGAASVAGKPVKLQHNDFVRVMAQLPGNAGVIAGTHLSLVGFDATGRQRWLREQSSDVFGAVASADGRLVAAALADGTIRWYRSSDGSELLALFVQARDRRWIAWTPTGYYLASPGGEDLIGWRANRGWDQAADLFPASRFRDRFSRPDVVKLVLATLDEAAALRQADTTARRPDSSFSAGLPPVVTIVSPSDGSSFAGASVAVEVEVRSPSGKPVEGIDVLIDGRPAGERGFDRAQEPAASAPPAKGERRTLTVNLPQRGVEIGIIAHAGGLSSTVARVRLAPAGSAVPAAGKPKLFALIVGVSAYRDPALRLNYADKDANDFAAALKGQADRLYGAIETRVLTNDAATAAQIRAGLDWLRGTVGENDIGLIFLAGHGASDPEGHYWFVPQDADKTALAATAVSKDEIIEAMRRLPGKAIIFLDTCHAGQGIVTRGLARSDVDLNTTLNALSAPEDGIIAFASSTGREVSIENAAWRNGAFTKALIEAVAQGKADLLKDGQITTSELDAYVEKRVSELTDGTQHPVMRRPETVPDFPIAAAF